MFLLIRFACGHTMRLASFFRRLVQLGATVYCFECDHITEISSIEEE